MVFDPKVFATTYHRNTTRRESGEVTMEMISYGYMEIAIQIEYRDGKPLGETYFYKRKVVSRKKYEAVRAAYPEMPPPNSGLSDSSGELLADVAKERKLNSARLKVHKPIPASAARKEAFCRELLARPSCTNAVAWIEGRRSVLGELDRRSSKSLITSLVRGGASSVTVVEMERKLDGTEIGSLLVVGLPEDPAKRRKLFKIEARVAERGGFDPTPDDGESSMFLKVD